MDSDQLQQRERTVIQCVFEDGDHKGDGIRRVEGGTVGAEIQNRSVAQSGKAEEEDRFKKEELIEEESGFEEKDRDKEEDGDETEECIEEESRLKESLKQLWLMGYSGSKHIVLEETAKIVHIAMECSDKQCKLSNQYYGTEGRVKIAMLTLSGEYKHDYLGLIILRFERRSHDAKGAVSKTICRQLMATGRERMGHEAHLVTARFWTMAEAGDWTITMRATSYM